MTERERWVVYPLLFLALGASLRDKLGGQTTAKSVVCQELIVIDEQPLGREPVLLARIGRPEPNDRDHPSGGQLWLNGQFTVVDLGPEGPHQSEKRLVRIGRASQAPGTPSVGYLWIQGQVIVNGPINALHYAYQGVPFMPALRQVLPGLPDLLRAVPQAIAPGQEQPEPPGAKQEAAPPSQPGEPSSPPSAEPSSDGGDETQSE
jgi:hypothetical protein